MLVSQLHSTVPPKSQKHVKLPVTQPVANRSTWAAAQSKGHLGGQLNPAFLEQTNMLEEK